MGWRTRGEISTKVQFEVLSFPAFMKNFNLNNNNPKFANQFNPPIQIIRYYFTDCQTVFSLKNLSPKFRCILCSKPILKCTVFDLNFLPVLKMAIYLMLWETYLYLATLDLTGSSADTIFTMCTHTFTLF